MGSNWRRDRRGHRARRSMASASGLGNGIGNGIGFGDRWRLDRARSPRAARGAGTVRLEGAACKAASIRRARPRSTRTRRCSARVTVDETGDVVGAHMVRTLPGSRGEIASSMIWQFRYSPALDDDGKPVRSTFVQTFARARSLPHGRRLQGRARCDDSRDSRTLRSAFGFRRSAARAVRSACGEARVDRDRRRDRAARARRVAAALPPPGTPEYDRLATRGKQAFARGEVGVVILAGGMATRFGGVVKAAVPVAGGNRRSSRSRSPTRADRRAARTDLRDDERGDARSDRRASPSAKTSPASSAFRSWSRCG